MRKAKKFGIGIGILILLFFVVVGLASSGYEAQEEKLKTPTLSTSQIKSQAIDGISYDELMRNNENYVGDIVHYNGKIIQAQNNYGDTYTLRVCISEEIFCFDDMIWVNYAGPRVLEDDLIEFWGEVQGIKEYSAVLGNKIAIPEVNSLILDVTKKQG